MYSNHVTLLNHLGFFFIPTSEPSKAQCPFNQENPTFPT
jgi:hypothetical protein